MTRYPELLRQSPDAPAVLYVRGDPARSTEPQLAMVGSRNPTAGGVSTAREFAAWFARAGLTITSGLALGIDAACHEGALAAGGLTVAVLGCGLDRVYPPSNQALAERIAAARRGDLRISAGRAAAGGAFSAAQPHHRGLEPRHPRHRSGHSDRAR